MVIPLVRQTLLMWSEGGEKDRSLGATVPYTLGQTKSEQWFSVLKRAWDLFEPGAVSHTAMAMTVTKREAFTHIP